MRSRLTERGQRTAATVLLAITVGAACAIVYQLRAPKADVTPLLAGSHGGRPVGPSARASTGGAPNTTGASAPDAGRITLTVATTITVPGLAPRLPWPSAGQARLDVLGVGTLGGSGSDGEVPIASIAKVMTAYVILRDHPLRPGEQGPAIVVQPAEAAAYAGERQRQESLVRVSAGEVLTERQALEALLIPSADNVARVLARWDAGGGRSFVARMNATAGRLKMTRSHYTDPSGLAATTTSTPADQLLLAVAALRDPTFAEIVAMPSATIPVAGKITNYNTLLGRSGIVGIKTGSTTQAGGCLLFAARRAVPGSNGRLATIVGVVLSQPGTPAISLPKVLSASRTLAIDAGNSLRYVTVLHAGQAVASVQAADGSTGQLRVARDVSVLAWPGLTLRLQLPSPSPTSSQSASAAVLIVTPGGSVRVPLITA